MMLHPSVFKAYDVRGRYPDEVDAEGSGRIAAAFAALLRREGVEEPSCVLGRDARLSSEPIAAAVRAALVSSGVRVLDIGLTTTPLFYFAVQHFRADGGIMVTASHIPPPMNGLKICRAEAVAVSAGNGMEELRDGALAGLRLFRSGGTVETVDAMAPYLAFLKGEVNVRRTLRLIVDPANGMAGLVLEALLPMLPELSVEKLHFELDGSFPNHEANPLKEEALADLKDALRRSPADLGIAFDGDADRVGFVTPSGETVRMHAVLALLAEDALRRSPGATVLYAANMSRVVPEVVREAGGRAVRVKIGHANISRAMREHDAILGGELSGHLFFREFFGRDDAMLAMIRMLNLLSAHRSIEELLAPLRRYVQSGEMNFAVEDREGALRRVEEAFADGAIDKLDGLTVSYADWWFNLRPSNTEPLVRLNVEARTAEMLEEKLELLRRILVGTGHASHS